MPLHVGINAVDYHAADRSTVINGCSNFWRSYPLLSAKASWAM